VLCKYECTPLSISLHLADGQRQTIIHTKTLVLQNNMETIVKTGQYQSSCSIYILHMAKIIEIYDYDERITYKNNKIY
jgi:hypothetical protein